jgi:hypothetical protein
VFRAAGRAPTGKLTERENGDLDGVAVGPRSRICGRREI